MSVLGIIFSYNEKDNLRELTKIRTTASVPIAGKYRLIDFMLSNFVNSNIFDISILTRNNYHSLMDHVGSGREWDLNRKLGGLRILTPMSAAESMNSSMYRGQIESLSSNMHSIKRSMADYVILTGSSILYTLDFQELLVHHINRNADITMMYTRQFHGHTYHPADMSILDIDEEGRIRDLHNNQENTLVEGTNCSLDVFVMRKSLLETLVADAMANGRFSFDYDIIQRLASRLNICGFEYKDYFLAVDSVSSYMQANLDLLNPESRNQLFKKPVYTKVKDGVPAQFAPGCKVSNSIISDNCYIEGTVENCVLSRDVRIGRDAVVKNCIIMQNTEIMRNVKLDHVILDKDVIVRENRQISGHETYPVVIEKLSIV